MNDFLRRLHTVARPGLAAACALVLIADVALVGARAGGTRPQAQSLLGSEGGTPAVTSGPARAKTSERALPRNGSTVPPVHRFRGAGCGGRADFNGDGYADLAIGVPLEDVGTVRDAGAVQVMYGGREGVSARGNQLWTQDSPGVVDRAEPGDQFGGTLAAADFNGDGFDDLAIGAPNEDTVNSDEGAVVILFGSRSGLSGPGSQFWHQDSSGIPEEGQIHDQFGRGLAAGDFDGDGFSDLAVGVPFEDLKRVGYLSANGSAGQVHVLYGTRRGLAATRTALLNQDTDGAPDQVEGEDLFGWSLTEGDFDGDGYCDIAVGVPAEDVNGHSEAGGVSVFYGGAPGLGGARAQFWTQDSPRIAETADSSDQFGYSIGAGDFDGNGIDDLVIGVLNEDIGDNGDCGAVNVIYGTRLGLAAAGSTLMTQDFSGVPDKVEQSDEFGFSVASGDFDADGYGDLAIGVPYETIDRETVTGTDFIDGAGAVTIVYGGARGLSGAGSQFWSQDSPGVEETAEAGDLFGFALAPADYDHDGADDLAVGVAREGFAKEQPNAGGVNLFYGKRGSGIRVSRNHFWRQGADGLPDVPEDDDIFGATVAG